MTTLHYRTGDLDNMRAEARQVQYSGWVNVYRWFSSGFIWPRGIPLECLQECKNAKLELGPLQLRMPDSAGPGERFTRRGCRLAFVFDREFNFDAGPSVWLAPGSWCPFNSQSTWWFRNAFALLYLPSLVSFRVTDIWRSLIAQEMPMGAWVWRCIS